MDIAESIIWTSGEQEISAKISLKICFLLGRIMREKEGVVVTVRGRPLLLALPLNTEEGREVLSLLADRVYEKFIGRGRSGERDVSERHDEVVYEEG